MKKDTIKIVEKLIFFSIIKDVWLALVKFDNI